MLIQSLPATGKTWIVAANANHVDGDDVESGEVTPEEMSHYLGSASAHYCDSRWFSRKGLEPDIVFVPHYDTWIGVIEEERSDILEVADFEKLSSWYVQYLRVFVQEPVETKALVIQGAEGEMLSDALARCNVEF